MIKEDKETLGKIVGKRNIVVTIMYIALQLMTIATLVTVIVFYVRGDTTITSSTFIMQITMCSLALIFFNTLLILEHIFKFFIPDYLLLLGSAFVFVNCIVGNVFQLFNTQNGVFDKILHVATGIIFAFFALSVVNLLNDLPRTRSKLSPFFVVIFCFCFSMMIAVVWEIFEYALDSIQPSLNMQRWADSFIDEVGDSGAYLLTDPRGSAITDTVWDMTCNVIGSLFTCMYCYVKIRRYSADWIIRKSILTPKQQKILINEQKKILAAQQLTTEEVKRPQLFNLKEILSKAPLFRKSEAEKMKNPNEELNKSKAGKDKGRSFTQKKIESGKEINKQKISDKKSNSANSGVSQILYKIEGEKSIAKKKNNIKVAKKVTKRK